MLDDEHAQPANLKNEAEGMTVTSENNIFIKRLQFEEDDKVNFDNSTYVPNMRRSEQQSIVTERFWYKVAIVTMDSDGSSEVP